MTKARVRTQHACSVLTVGISVVTLLAAHPLSAATTEIDEANWQDANAWACAKTIAIRPPAVTGDFKGVQSQDAYSRRFADELARGLRARFGADAVTVVQSNEPTTADIIIEGEFATLTTGSRAKRFWVGFGAGKSWVDARLRAKRTSTDDSVFSLRQERGSAVNLKADSLQGDVDDAAHDIAAYLVGNATTCDSQAWIQREPPAKPEVAATLIQVQVGVSLSSIPAAADVYIDGAFVGSTPIAELQLPPGSHEIAIGKKGYLRWSRTLRVLAGSPTRINAELEADRSDTAGAR